MAAAEPDLSFADALPDIDAFEAARAAGKPFDWDPDTGPTPKAAPEAAKAEAKPAAKATPKAKAAPAASAEASVEAPAEGAASTETEQPAEAAAEASGAGELPDFSGWQSIEDVKLDAIPETLRPLVGHITEIAAKATADATDATVKASLSRSMYDDLVRELKKNGAAGIEANSAVVVQLVEQRNMAVRETAASQWAAFEYAHPYYATLPEGVRASMAHALETGMHLNMKGDNLFEKLHSTLEYAAFANKYTLPTGQPATATPAGKAPVATPTPAPSAKPAAAPAPSAAKKQAVVGAANSGGAAPAAKTPKHDSGDVNKDIAAVLADAEYALND